MSTRELSFAQAIQEGLAQAMEADERVFIMGEDIGVYGGAFGVTGDLVHRFGEDRVRDTPIAELGGAGVAVGATKDAPLTGAIRDLDQEGIAEADVAHVHGDRARYRLAHQGQARQPGLDAARPGSLASAVELAASANEELWGSLPSRALGRAPAGSEPPNTP